MQLLLVILLIALAIGGIAIKMFLKPGHTFTKTCGSRVDPRTGRPMPCSCHSDAPDDCDKATLEEDSKMVV